MGTIAVASNQIIGEKDGSIRKVVWGAMATGDDGQPFEMPEWSDNTFAFTGTIGGATIRIQGSNDGTNWFNLSNAAGGAAVGITAVPGGATIIERPQYIRPQVTGGAASGIVATLISRRPNPMRN